MSLREFFGALTVCAAATFHPAWAQDASSFPSKVVRIIAPAAPGGPSDTMARLVAERLSRALGQQVIVENRPGASQMLGTDLVAKAAPDGHTLLLATSSAIVMLPSTGKQMPYDPKRDLTMVAHLATTPLVLYAHSAMPVSNLQQMIALAKSKPGKLSYGSFGNGTSANILGEYFSKRAGVKMVHVPYKGIVPMATDLAGTQIDFGIGDAGSPAPFVKAGKIKALAASGKARSATLPDVPTFAELGIAGMEPFSSWLAVMAPANTPKPIVDRLSAEIVKIVRAPEMLERYHGIGLTPTGLGAANATELMNAEMAVWQKIISDVPDVKFD